MTDVCKEKKDWNLRWWPLHLAEKLTPTSSFPLPMASRPPSYFLTKLISLFETVSQPRNVSDDVQYDCPLLLINLMEVLWENENRTFDRLFHPSNCVFLKGVIHVAPPPTLFFSSPAYVWPKWSTFQHKTTWQFYPWKKCSPLFRMTLLDSDTLLCLIKLINCLMDHKSANTLMGPGVLCWFKPFYITL